VPHSLFIGGHHIADAADRMQQLRREVFVDFAPQPADLDVDNIGLRVKGVIPDRLQQHRPGNDLPLVPHKVLEQAELARLKRNRLACTLCPSRSQIESQIGDPKFVIVLSDSAVPRRSNASTRASSSENAKGLVR
jgi:hypothetical protein